MSKPFSDLEIWFITGTQHLYGDDVLAKVNGQSKQIADHFDNSELVPARIVHQPIVKTADEIVNVMQRANNSSQCAGVIVWMHTFSPAKMWINGLKILHKPLLHLHTQFNRDIPWSDIDMDFMNLNQSAHGDREAGHIMMRMNIKRKVVTGHWSGDHVTQSISAWIRAAAGWHDWQGAKFVRFGDNMRNVAVTEGDKVEAEIQFGFSVNTHGVGDLVNYISKVSNKEIDSLCDQYAADYSLSKELSKNGPHYASLRDAAKIEAGLTNFLNEGGYKGFTDTFEDLHGLVQLPGIAVQRLMNKGFGFAAEGDWKTSALVRAMKTMARGLQGGNSFMEDYTYHFEPGNEMVLGAHMLEICPSIARDKPRCEIHPLGIGGKPDPVRLVFDVSPGAALNASLIDVGTGFRLLVNEVNAVEAPHDLPKLPVARVLWKPLPDIYTACTAWILAGGAHHTCYSQNISVDMLEDFAEIAGIDMLLIDANTNLRGFKNDLQRHN